MIRLKTILVVTIGALFSVNLSAQDLPKVVNYTAEDVQQIFNILTQSSEGKDLKMSEVIELKDKWSLDNYLSKELELPLMKNGNVDFNGQGYRENSKSILGVKEDIGKMNIYPNPIVDQFYINYELKKEVSNVRITLNDILGNEIQVLSERNQLMEGKYSAQRTIDVSPGVYFIFFNVDGVVHGEKVNVIN